MRFVNWKKTASILITFPFVLTATPLTAKTLNHLKPQSKVQLVANNDTLAELNQRVEQHYRRGNYQQAIPLVKRMLEMQRKIFGEEHPSFAIVLNKLAFLYTAQGQYQRAIPIYQKTLKLKRKLLGVKHPQVATSLDHFAGLYLRQGQYDLAEKLHKQALEIRLSKFGEIHPDTVTSFKNLATLYQHQGRYARSETFYQKALKGLAKTLGENHPYARLLSSSLASLYVAQGKYQVAELRYQNILKQARNASQPNAPLTISTLHRLALLQLHQGRYDLAEPLAVESLELSEKHLGKRHPYMASGLNILASIYRLQGRYPLAEAKYQQSLKLVREINGERHPHVAHGINNLALLYLERGQYPQAVQFAKQALALRKELLGDQHPEVATGAHNLALIYARMGRYDLAEPLYQQAISIKQAVLGDVHPDLLASRQSLASLYQAQKKYDRAEKLHRQALAQAKEIFGAQHPQLAQKFLAVASLYQQQERYGLAVNLLNQALEVEENNLRVNLAIGAEQQKHQYIAKVKGSTNAAISLHLQDAPQNLEAQKLALTTLLRRKGRILDVSSNPLRMHARNLDPNQQSLLQQLTQKRSQLASLYYAPTKLNPKQYRDQLYQLNQAAETIESQLAQVSRAFEQALQPTTVEAVQRKIPANATLLEFIRYTPFDAQAVSGQRWGEARYGVYLLNAAGQIRAMDLGPADKIEPLVNKFRNSLSRRKGDVKQTARQLDMKIMQPVRSLLGKKTKKTHLIVSPDSQLNLIPFAALVDEQHRYLVESYEISYVTSGRDLLRWQNAESSQAPPLVIANPTYDRPSAAHQGKDIQAVELTRTNALSNLVFGPLPGTAKEAAAIGPKLLDANVLTGAKATENAVKKIVAPSILHIATHGFFLADQPRLDLNRSVRGVSHPFRSDIVPTVTNPTTRPAAKKANLQNALLRSGLALAGFNSRQSGAEDGVLTALEVSNLQLQGTQLVVLSACETAVGDIANGEGVYGLRRALVLAGAQSQVISLWKVDDTGTKDLMVGYYDNLMQNQGRSGALRQVQLDAIKNRQYRHPFFWAAFIPSGQWQPLK